MAVHRIFAWKDLDSRAGASKRIHGGQSNAAFDRTSSLDASRAIFSSSLSYVDELGDTFVSGYLLHPV
jgi:hypothetical protein